MSEINFYLQDLFIQHGVGIIPLEQRALLLTKRLALLQGHITQQQYPNGITSRLDVQVTIKDRTIIECFGDIGDTAEAATQSNLRNFAHNSLHVLIGALQSTEEEEQISIEQWQIGAQQWKVYGGNYGIKSSAGKAVQIPDKLFTHIERIIQALPLTEEYHWFRFFVCCIDNQISQLEFLVDNKIYAEATQELTALDWHQTPEFYSIRLFIVLQKVT
ncbi:DUF6348 family protein [Hymenobacter sp.]|jgi:hypothetical protein|uniref:DUF6348 family protein n=1 Tax=Hymenobacter sp. TaxID=1898978 RepID=UPI002ED8FBA8